MHTAPSRPRQVLLAALLALLAGVWSMAPAAAVGSSCWETEAYGGLFCNDGSMMEVCDLGGGDCTISCGQGTVPLSCIEPE